MVEHSGENFLNNKSDEAGSVFRCLSAKCCIQYYTEPVPIPIMFTCVLLWLWCTGRFQSSCMYDFHLSRIYRWKASETPWLPSFLGGVGWGGGSISFYSVMVFTVSDCWELAQSEEHSPSFEWWLPVDITSYLLFSKSLTAVKTTPHLYPRWHRMHSAGSQTQNQDRVNRCTTVPSGVIYVFIDASACKSGGVFDHNAATTRLPLRENRWWAGVHHLDLELTAWEGVDLLLCVRWAFLKLKLRNLSSPQPC